MIYTTTTNTERLQVLYLDWINNFLTSEQFAEHKGMAHSDAEQLINISRTAHELVVAIQNDDRYTVKNLHMGANMHNWQAFFNDTLIGYAFTQDGAWACCGEYHINYLIHG